MKKAEENFSQQQSSDTVTSKINVPTNFNNPPPSISPLAISTKSNCSFIKPSVSMISLPPKEQQDGREVIKAKLRMERPYNSLKKKRNSDTETNTWRHSWGSAHSHSSCSLHSNATGVGKDDFWAALQTNYNYIMDTNLLDACKEARHEIEGTTNTNTNLSDCCQKRFLQSSKPEGSCENPEELRKWLNKMESKLSKAPSLSEATQMSTAELKRRLSDHSALYCEIVSHARVVGACIRASKKDEEKDNYCNSGDESSIVKKKISSPNGENLKFLERRYHLLYLKAIEVQCLFESLLGKKNSSSVLSRASSTETDDEPASKLARLSDSETNTHVSCDLLSLQQTLSDENRFELDDDSEEWPDLSFNTIINVQDFQANAEFDADSEGSEDDEINKKSRSVFSKRDKYHQNFNRLTKLTKNNELILSETMDTNSYQRSGCSIDFLLKSSDNNRKIQNSNHLILDSGYSSLNPTTSLTTVNTGVIIKSKTPSPISNKKQQNQLELVVEQQRQKKTDTSKFNRSNRKSKNCAIFYFKHLDTDNENFGGAISSQGSDVLKSGEQSSDDEGWLFSNDCIDGGGIIKHSTLNDDSDKENKEIECGNNNLGNCSVGEIQKVTVNPTIISQAMTMTTVNMNGGFVMDSKDVNHQDISNSNGEIYLNEETKEHQMSNNCAIENMSNTMNNDISTDAATITITSGNDTTTSSTIPDNHDGDVIKSGTNSSKGEIDIVDGAVTDNVVFITNKAYTEINNKSPMMTTKTSEMKTTKLEMPQIMNKECSHESIKQLVIDAENLVMRVPRSPVKRHAKVKNPSTFKKREINMPGPNIKRVQEWLQHQPTISPKDALGPFSIPTTDCEASAENTESDSAARESDTSEGFTDSVATCMQGCSTSQCTSTEIINKSTDPIAITTEGSNQSLVMNTNAGAYSNSGKVIRRSNRRNSDRPWSVSCLSQLTESATIKVDKVMMANNQDLASHSVSETALHILSSPVKKKSSPQSGSVKNSDSKNSLRRRKPRRRKTVASGIIGKRSDSGSEGITLHDLPKLTQNLIKSESINGQINIIQDVTAALEMVNLSKVKKIEEKTVTAEIESEEEPPLMKPNFKLGLYTSSYMASESKLGSLAALANYMNEDQGATTPTNGGREYHTGTEDHSSFSEQAWDNYQEKYNSENYSEGFDSDAARKLLEFGDDYRNFLDSQSDCCSSLSAANNFDSMSPPQMDSLNQNDTTLKLTPQTISNITSSVDHARRRRALELQYERRRKTSETRKKSSHDDVFHLRSPNTSSTTLLQLSPRSSEKLNNSRSSNNSDVHRKLEFDFNCSSQSLRKTSESDNSTRRRKSEEGCSSIRRRSSKNLEKSFKTIPSTSSSSNDESDDEKEMKNLLSQSRNRLENTNALKIRSHLLRPEDYAEIVATCRDNIRCLESVLRGPPGAILSTPRINETKDLLSSWENLLGWSENAATARSMQQEMVVLKNALSRLGRQICKFDSDSSIQFAIEELKNEKTQLQAFRTNMLRLNASVHSWLTRQEIKLKKELEALANDNEIDNINNNANNVVIGDDVNNQEKGSQIDTIMQSENEFHKHLKDEVSDMYSAWDEADARINTHLEALNASLMAWRQLESGLFEFHQVLGKDRGTLEGLEGALDRGQTTPSELAHNVKLVAKLLSEKMDCSQQQQVNISSHDQGQPEIAHRILSIAQFTSSNGSLSDSGISDGGATSDGGLSERERRLGVLRRLAKQLENALAPGSEALKSITARMEAAEAELKTLQNTCRELIVRTAVSQHKKSQGLVTYATPLGLKAQQKNKKTSPSAKKKNRRKSTSPTAGISTNSASLLRNLKKIDIPNGKQFEQAIAPDSGDPGDPNDDSWELCNTSDDDDSKKNNGWAWRVAKIAFPMQLALLTLFCAACLLEPHCCDSLNNLSMSFTPQLRYVRGPPPI